jgi:pimeloyl-ACP methyl ester carboxylesterase
MVSQLTNFVSPITVPLYELQGHFSRMAAMHREAHMHLCSQRDSLTVAATPELFAGSGAMMFSEAVDYYVQISERHMQLLDSAAYGVMMCLNNIDEAVMNVHTGMLDLALLEAVLGEITLEGVLQDGGNEIHRVLQDMLNTLEDAFHNPGHTISDVSKIRQETELLLLLSVLTAFGWAVYHAVNTCLNLMTSIAVPPNVPRLSAHTPQDQVGASQLLGSANGKLSVGSLAGATSTLEKENIPIAIVRVQGQNTIIVMLAGLNLTKFSDLNNLADAIDAGGGNANDSYILAVQKAIEQFLKENNMPPDTQVILAGHSQGGIVAQYIASNHDNAGYQVADVFTFGSPQPMAPNSSKNEHYFQYVTQYDAVPFLSWYEFGPLLKKYGWSGALQYINQVNTSGMQAKINFTQQMGVDDVGTNPQMKQWVRNDHTQYNQSKELQGLYLNSLDPKQLNFDAAQLGPVTYYTAPPENFAVDSYRTLSTLQHDVNGSSEFLPGSSNLLQPLHF